MVTKKRSSYEENQIKILPVRIQKKNNLNERTHLYTKYWISYSVNAAFWMDRCVRIAMGTQIWINSMQLFSHQRTFVWNVCFVWKWNLLKSTLSRSYLFGFRTTKKWKNKERKRHRDELIWQHSEIFWFEVMQFSLSWVKQNRKCRIQVMFDGAWTSNEKNVLHNVGHLFHWTWMKQRAFRMKVFLPKFISVIILYAFTQEK